MDTTILGFIAVLVPLLALIAWFERRAARRLELAALGELDEARTRGSHRPLAQHPQIDPLQCVGCGLCVKACPEDGVLAVLDGIARVVHGSRCVGHGRCETACPVGAIAVGLGAVAERDDVPVLAPTQESIVPGLYLAGELTGIALIRHAVAQATTAIDAIVARGEGSGAAPARPGAALMDDGRVDVAIVGAGPAGLAAALRCIERKRSHVLIEQEELGGTILHYPRAKLVMTQPVELPLLGRLRKTEYRKEELVELFHEAAQRFPLRLKTRTRVEAVVRVEGDGGFAVRWRDALGSGELRARAVVLALGRRGTPRKLGVPGEELPKVAYRLVDAALHRDEDLLVVGGGDSAVEAALALAAQPGNRVTLSYRKEAFFRLKPRNEQRIAATAGSGGVRVLFGSEVIAIEPDRVELRLAADGGARPLSLPNDHVLVFAGGTPPFELLRAAGVTFGAESRRPSTAIDPRVA